MFKAIWPAAVFVMCIVLIGYGEDPEAAGRLYKEFMEKTDQAAVTIAELMAEMAS